MCHSNGRVGASIYQALAHFVGVCLQFDFVELLDGRRLLAQDVHGLEGPVAMQRSLIPITTHDTGFIKYMDSGIWHLAIYNDGKETETVSFLTSAIGEQIQLLGLTVHTASVQMDCSDYKTTIWFQSGMG